jgi:hypothetical protein
MTADILSKSELEDIRDYAREDADGSLEYAEKVRNCATTALHYLRGYEKWVEIAYEDCERKERAMQERDEARAEVGRLRELAEIQDELLTGKEMLLVSYRIGGSPEKALRTIEATKDRLAALQGGGQ